MSDAGPTTTLDEELAAAHERHEAREKAETQRKKQHELAGLKLIEKFEAEIGPRRSKFTMVDLGDIGEGFVVMKLGDAVIQKKFESAIAKLKDKEKLDEQSIDQYVTPCVVHPSESEFRALCGRRYNLWSRCASALAKLYGVKRDDDEGKF